MCKITFWDSLKKHWHILYKFFNLFEVGWRLKKCLCHLLHSEVISFFVTRECQKIRKINQNKWCNWRGKSSYLLNDLRNFKKIFRKDLIVIILKATENQSFNLSLSFSLFLSLTLSLKNSSLEKGVGQIDPPVVLGLKCLEFLIRAVQSSKWPFGKLGIGISAKLSPSTFKYDEPCLLYSINHL